jgi:hypothetical protein
LLAFAPIINIGLVPGIIGGLGLYTIYQVWKTKNIYLPLKEALPSILSTLFLIVFYKINGGYDIENQTVINTFSSGLNTKGEILKIIYKIGYAFIFLILIYGVYFLVFTSKKRIEISHSLSLLIGFILLSGLLTRIIFEGFNTPQFLTYVLPLLNVYLIYLFSYCYIHSSLRSKIAGILIISLCLNNVYQTYFHTTTRREISISEIHDKRFLKKTAQLLAKNPTPTFGYLLSDSDFKTIPPGFWYGYYPCEFLLTKDCFKFYSLNFPNQLYAANSQQSNNFSPNHLRYILPHTMKRGEYEKAVIQFINKNNIDYILAKKNSSLPTSIQKTIKDSLVDPKTGDRILFVKH